MERIITTENAVVVREFVSPVTTVRWDPISNTGSVTYSVHELLFINGVFHQMRFVGDSTVTLERLLNNVYDIDVGNGQVAQIPGGLIMLAFKKAFENEIAAGTVHLGAPSPLPTSMPELPAEPDVVA